MIFHFYPSNGLKHTLPSHPHSRRQQTLDSLCLIVNSLLAHCVRCAVTKKIHLAPPPEKENKEKPGVSTKCFSFFLSFLFFFKINLQRQGKHLDSHAMEYTLMVHTHTRPRTQLKPANAKATVQTGHTEQRNIETILWGQILRFCSVPPSPSSSLSVRVYSVCILFCYKQEKNESKKNS